MGKPLGLLCMAAGLVLICLAISHSPVFSGVCLGIFVLFTVMRNSTPKGG